MSRFKKLVKQILFENNILIEGIEEVKKYFPLISDEDFNMLVSLDPTYKNRNELGKYGKWILSLYNNFLKDQKSYLKWKEQQDLGKNYPEPPKKSKDKIEDFEKLPNLLKQFDAINKKAKVNINNLKSVSDLASIVSQEKDKGISDNDKVNRGIDLFKKSIEKGGKIVFKDNNWIVLIPETLASSVVFGEDTNWCTTTSNGELYNRYLEEFGGQYFINLDLFTGELYQFHFESNQFMNSSDKSVELQEIVKDEKLKQFYVDYIKNHKFKYKNICLLQLGIKFSEEKLLNIINKNPMIIRYIKNPSEEMKLVAVKKHGRAIRYIKNPSEKMKLIAIQCDGPAIRYIKNPSEKMQLIAVKKYGRIIKDIIENRIEPSEEVQLAAVKQDGAAIYWIKNPSEKIQLAAVQQDSEAIRYIKNPSKKVKQLAKKNKYKNDYIKTIVKSIERLAKEFMKRR